MASERRVSPYTDDSANLLPCPMCGGKAQADCFIVVASVRCTECRLTVTRGHRAREDSGLPEAIQAWQRRAPAQASEARGDDGSLPPQLWDVSDEWYVLCERAAYVDKIKISGQLAEAIVAAICAGSWSAHTQAGPVDE